MDAFEKHLQQMAKADTLGIKDYIEESKKRCICASCPTYNDCTREKKELAYCLVGKTKGCEISELSCICPDCPLTKELGLRFTYYCTLGSEKQLRKQHM